MSGILSRRSLLAGAGYAAAGTLAARLVSGAETQQAAPSLCLTMVFMNEAKAKLDSKRFVKNHVPLLRSIYGDSVERIEFRTVQAPSPGMPPSPILASTHIWIKNTQGFSMALREGAARINEDLDKTAKGTRISQVDMLAAGLGDPISEVKEATQVVTTLYPAQAGKELDKDYFKSTHVPKLLSIYGASAVRRVEGTIGQDQGGAKATYIAATYLYVRNRGDYDKDATANLGEMIEDAKKYTTIFPQFADMRVQVVG